MLKSCRQNNQKVLESIKNAKIDAADISFSNFIDDIILKMSKMEIINYFEDVVEDKRCCKNSQIPLNILFVLAATAKMKIMTSLTDIPYAIIDSDTLAELGWNIYDTNRELEKRLISEGALRGFLDHYVAEEFIDLYNDYTRL